MHFVLYEEINQRDHGPKEQYSSSLPVLHGPFVGWGCHETAHCPGNRSHKIADHEDIVPIMIVGGCHIYPSATQNCPKQTNTSSCLGQYTRSVCQEIPKAYQGESGTGCNGDEDLENRSFRIEVADRSRDRREPLFWISIVLVFHDLSIRTQSGFQDSVYHLFIVQQESNNEGSEESRISYHCVRYSDVFSWELSVRAFESTRVAYH